ncbi:hypothetical protein KY289_019418 [Solanum tuberosum]|nr:hypothetical protein KY289_019418 [Solanum tuberosum]
MALRGTMLRTAGKFAGVNSNLRRFIHITSRPAPLDSVVDRLTATSPSLVLPENENNSNMFPNSPFNWGSMELMAVPKKKIYSTEFLGSIAYLLVHSNLRQYKLDDSRNILKLVAA